MFDTDAVFHAPMFALNADADWNACEPSHPQSTPTEGARMCRRGCVRAQSHTRTRASARTQHVRACVRRARIGGAAAHNGPRRIDDPAERILNHRPACTGRAAGAEKAAHTAYNVVTLAVFHAPMFALNADAA